MSNIVQYEITTVITTLGHLNDDEKRFIEQSIRNASLADELDRVEALTSSVDIQKL